MSDSTISSNSSDHSEDRDEESPVPTTHSVALGLVQKVIALRRELNTVTTERFDLQRRVIHLETALDAAAVAHRDVVDERNSMRAAMNRILNDLHENYTPNSEVNRRYGGNLQENGEEQVGGAYDFLLNRIQTGGRDSKEEQPECSQLEDEIEEDGEVEGEGEVIFDEESDMETCTPTV